jgi:hypothetical protein
MKKKISIKKLTLSKELISILNKNQNNLIFGGDDRKSKNCCTVNDARTCTANDSNNGGACNSTAC